MIDLSRKTVLFWDASGSYTHMAEAMVGAFGRVLYHVPWDTGFPASINALPGQGLDGIERIMDFFDALDETDLVIFTDVGMGGLQEYLRRQGMPVFGCAGADKLERDRYLLKAFAKNNGIGVAHAVPVLGLDNLRKVLEGREDLYVKVSYWRGDKETFKWDGDLSSGSHLDEMAVRMGPYGDLAEFVVEVPIDGDECCEVGADPPAVVDGMYPDICLWGYENKDKAYAGTTVPLPARIRDTLDRLAPVLREYRYRGPLSTETRETGKDSYLTDLTCRFPEPPSSLQRFMVRNLPEVFWEAAHGRLVEPDYVARIGVQIVLRSEYGAEHPVAVSVGRHDRVAIHGHANVAGQDYACSPAEIAECIGACGLADTLADAMEEAIDAAESVKGRDITFDKGALQELTETIQKGNSLGLNWSGRQEEKGHGREA